MREKAIQFGKSAVLSGILADPESMADSGDRPAFILLNSGILHRVGSCRLHVRLARALSAAGFSSLRFDFSGIGDSESRRDSLSFEQSSRAEVREAMDYIAQSRGTKRFVLMGLCSGADMAHLTAVEDERVCGLIFIDGWAYRTRRYWLHYYLERLFNGEVWRNWANIRVRRMLGETSVRRAPAPAGDQISYDVPTYIREFPPREKVAGELATFMKRGMNVFAIFTGGLVDHFNHQSQYRSCFREVDFGNRLRVDFISSSDHIITNLSHQARVVAQVTEWARTISGVSDAVPAEQRRIVDFLHSRGGAPTPDRSTGALHVGGNRG